MNDLDTTFYAILEIWDELPRLVGPPFAELFPRLREKLERIDAATPDEREERIFELFDCLYPHAAVRARLAAVRRHTETVRSHAEARGEVPWFDDASGLYGPALRERLRPPKVERDVDVSAPRSLPVGEWGLVTVRLLEKTDGKSTEGLELLFSRQVEIRLIAITPGIEIEIPVQRLDLQLAKAEMRAFFPIHGAEAGRQHLSVVFSQAGEELTRIPLIIEVGTRPVSPEPSAQEPVRLESPGLSGAPSDLDFLVFMAIEETVVHLRYLLVSPILEAAASYRDGGRVEIEKRRLEESCAGFYRSLGEMEQDATGAEDPRAARAHRRLLAIGEKIYKELLNDDLRIFFDALDKEKVRSLRVISEEPWIPWELLRLEASEHASASGEEEAFLCERFALTRWLTGDWVAAPSLAVSRVIRIMATREPVPDDDAIFEDARATGSLVEERRSASLAEVEDAFDHDLSELWHFEVPGTTSLDGRRTGIHFENGDLWPEDVDAERGARLAERHPLLFLNVAEAGRLDRGTTRLEGWAPMWLSRCGGMAFIAPVGRVDEDLGRLFCRRFYAALSAGEPLAEATRTARRAVRAQDPVHPTWALYSVYGHPNARITFVTPHEVGAGEEEP